MNDPFHTFLRKVQDALLNPLITLLSLAAFVLFVWGVVEFVASAGSDEGREKGKRHMIWGIIGLVVLFGAKAIVLLMATSVGYDLPASVK